MTVITPAALIENNRTTEFANTGGRPVVMVLVILKIRRRQTWTNSSETQVGLSTFTKTETMFANKTNDQSNLTRGRIARAHKTLIVCNR